MHIKADSWTAKLTGQFLKNELGYLKMGIMGKFISDSHIYIFNSFQFTLSKKECLYENLKFSSQSCTNNSYS